jgi:hypothetical protein
MNRRSFFGFACGGLVAAPAALLVGEAPSSQYIQGEILPFEPVDPNPAVVHVIKVEVQRAMAIAMRQAEETRLRGFSAAQYRHAWQKA